MSSTVLQKVAPPALPQATDQYNRPYQDQLNNVQRLFYNRLTQSYNNLISPSQSATQPPGGANLYFPFADIIRNGDLTFTANTATAVVLNTLVAASGCTIDGSGGITVQHTGFYNYSANLQFSNTDTAPHNAWLWLRRNGSDVANSGSKFDVPAAYSGSDGYLTLSQTTIVELAAGDLVELYAAVADSSVYLEAYTAQTTPFAMPAISAIGVTLTFVSAV